MTGISIPAVRKMSDHVLYQIDVSNERKRRSFRKWTVLKRFGQFFTLDQVVNFSLKKADVLFFYCFLDTKNRICRNES